jgi:hypothetical protein
MLYRRNLATVLTAILVASVPHALLAQATGTSKASATPQEPGAVLVELFTSFRLPARRCALTPD